MQPICIELTEHGYRVVARASVAPGRRIFHLEGAEVAVPTRYTVQIDTRLHIAPVDVGDPGQTIVRHPWMVTNHSCVPTALIRGRELLARVDLQPGDEVTFDYETTEFEMAEPFDCRCGHDHCRGTIRGFRHLDSATRRRLRPLLAPHLAALAGDA